MSSKVLLICLVAILSSFSFTAQGAIDAYVFPNDEMRDRYHVLIDELRCPQCLNTNLAGSDAMIAKDLRREVHRLVLEGYSDDDILDFMYERYGDFILYEPRIKLGTAALWFGPLFLLLLALFIGWRVANTRNLVVELSDQEQAKLDQMLASRGVDPDSSAFSKEDRNSEK